MSKKKTYFNIALNKHIGKPIIVDNFHPDWKEAGRYFLSQEDLKKSFEALTQENSDDISVKLIYDNLYGLAHITLTREVGLDLIPIRETFESRNSSMRVQESATLVHLIKNYIEIISNIIEEKKYV